MKSTILKSIALGVCLLTAGAASAQEKEPKVKRAKKFGKIDTNKDKKISLEEYNVFRMELRSKKGKETKQKDFSKRFKEIDADNDGVLSREEFKARKETKTPKKEKTKG